MAVHAEVAFTVVPSGSLTAKVYPILTEPSLMRPPNASGAYEVHGSSEETGTLPHSSSPNLDG